LLVGRAQPLGRLTQQVGEPLSHFCGRKEGVLTNEEFKGNTPRWSLFQTVECDGTGRLSFKLLQPEEIRIFEVVVS
jgi:hypothetical protein